MSMGTCVEQPGASNENTKTPTHKFERTTLVTRNRHYRSVFDYRRSTFQYISTLVQYNLTVEDAGIGQ